METKIRIWYSLRKQNDYKQSNKKHTQKEGSRQNGRTGIKYCSFAFYILFLVLNVSLFEILIHTSDKAVAIAEAGLFSS